MTNVEVRFCYDETISIDDEQNVNASVKFIRNTLKPDIEIYKEWVRMNLGSTTALVLYICDVCDERHRTLDDMFTERCDLCLQYYDYCKIHNITMRCPLCSKS